MFYCITCAAIFEVPFAVINPAVEMLWTKLDLIARFYNAAKHHKCFF